MHKISKNDYLKLCDLIWEHNRRYFIEDAPPISDYQFDQLFKQLVEIEKEHPEWIFPGSPTQRVGEAIKGGFAVKQHSTPMLSLANTYSEGEVEEFIARMQKLLAKKEIDYHVELKMDGIAISVRYEDGLFVQAVTRGDGEKGDDVTSNVRTIAALPLMLPQPYPKVLEVRGEVYLPTKSFLALNKKQLEAEKPLFANPRNAAGGTLKLLNPKIVAERGLSVAFFGIAELEGGPKIESQYESLQYLESLALPVVAEHALCKDLSEIMKFAKHVEKIRPKLPFEIDGIVVKVDHIPSQKSSA